MTDFVLSLLTIFEVVTALLLIVIILAQKSKTGGGFAFYGGAVEEVFGANTGNLMVKITVGLLSFFFVNTLIMAVLQKSETKGKNQSIVEYGMEGESLKSFPAPKEVSEPETPPVSIPESLPKEAESQETPVPSPSTATDKEQ